jgi:D-sedoheptulose 7-phosphate isomerase
MATILFHEQLAEATATFTAMEPYAPAVDAMIDAVAEAVSAGQTLFTCGNGGSAADALHLAEEFVGRYRSNRRPLPAVCLNADPTALTCIANDFGYDDVFARQLAALGRPGDVLVVFSTSGNSANIVRVMETARAQRMLVVGLLGKNGGVARELADHPIVVPSANSARIQEVHGLLLHAICEEVEQRFAA